MRATNRSAGTLPGALLMSSRDFSDFRAAQAVADSTFHRDELSSCVRVSLGEVCDPPLLSQLLVHPSEKKRIIYPARPYTHTHTFTYTRAHPRIRPLALTPPELP